MASTVESEVTTERRAAGRRPVPGGLKGLIILVLPSQREALERLADAEASTISAVTRRVIAAGLAAEVSR